MLDREGGVVPNRGHRGRTPATIAARLTFESVDHRYGHVEAVSRFDLDVAPGEIVILIGHSGCGKTTALRLAAGVEVPSAGRILINDQVVAGPRQFQPPEQRGVGLMFQDYALFPHLTNLANVMFGLKGLPREDAMREARLALARVGLEHYADAYPHMLSGGEQQRVALARALAPKPALLLLDEPLSALDARVRQSLRLEIRRLQRRLGVTTIMVTHDQEEALAMADRIVVMNHGAVEQVGSPIAVYTEPASPFVARFVGQMNFIAGTAGARAGWVRVGPAEVFCRAGERFAEGTPVTLAIRPEEILVGPGARENPNRLLTRVRGVQFLGAFSRLSLTLGEEFETVLECDVAANALAGLEAAEGAELTLALDPAALRLFPASR